EQSKALAEHLASVGLTLDRIEHSDKLRARQTAEIWAANLHPANGTIQVSSLAPNDDVESARARLNAETKNRLENRAGHGWLPLGKQSHNFLRIRCQSEQAVRASVLPEVIFVCRFSLRPVLQLLHQSRSSAPSISVLLPR